VTGNLPKIEITAASYGKSGVRVLSWGDGGTIRDVDLAIEVEGEFLESYRSGDNAAILPSDSLRRHALAECSAHPGASVERLLVQIGARVLEANPAFDAVLATAEIRQWARRGAHSHVLSAERGSSRFRLQRSGFQFLESGIHDLNVLITTGSGFSGFLRDAITVQADSADRPLCGTLDARWTYLSLAQAVESASGKLRAQVTAELLGALTDRPSKAVQQLLTEAGTVVLTAVPQLATLSLHFASWPLSPVPADLITPLVSARGNAYEASAGAPGMTDVVLRRETTTG
jgi:urate oxidase